MPGTTETGKRSLCRAGQHFVVDLHPDGPQVVAAAGFSGHGYKFCSVVGEILAGLATTGGAQHPIGLFSPERPG